MLGITGAAILSGCAPGEKMETPKETQPPIMSTPSLTESVPTIEPTPEPSPEYVRGTPWERDYTLMPNGPLSSEDWNFTTGTLVPGYNFEEQTYTSRAENARIENGALVIQARNENLDEREFTSARIDTRNEFAFMYGSLEITAMLPRGIGTWPAAWLLPSEPIYDPRELGVREGDRYEFAVNGEIDFLEAIGSIENENIPSAHRYNQRKVGDDAYTPGLINDAYGTFHRYGVIKSPGKIEFTLDGQVFASRQKDSEDPLDWPFEQNYYLILNLAMGGYWAGQDKDQFPPHGIDTSMSDSWQYKIQKITYTPL